MADTNGTTVLGYDALYRLNAVTYPNADAQSYTYDPMGNRLTKVNNSVTTNYTNDDADQMTAAGGVAYGYDNNGNQTSRGTDTFSYNAENRLTNTNLTGTAGSYVYNGDGLRTSRTIGAATTTFAWGAATGMPVILRDSAGNRYLYGLDLISVSDSGNTKTYYHTDGLGSTTAITNSTGAVVKTYQYDAFGAVRAQTGTQPNEFTFTGEQNDASGLEYLRARYYDSATGRFVGRDPLPLAQRYAYAGNNPANMTDPSGLCAESAFTFSQCHLHFLGEGVGRFPGARWLNEHYGYGHDRAVELSYTVTAIRFGESTSISADTWSDGRIGWISPGPVVVTSNQSRTTSISETFHRERSPLLGIETRANGQFSFDAHGVGKASGSIEAYKGNGPIGYGKLAELIKFSGEWWCDAPTPLLAGPASSTTS